MGAGLSGSGGRKPDLGGRYWKGRGCRRSRTLCPPCLVEATRSCSLAVPPTFWVYHASPWGSSCHLPGSKWGNQGPERTALALTEGQRLPGWHQPRPVQLGGSRFQKKTSGPLFRN